MNKFYIWTTCAIIVLCRCALGLTLLNFVYKYSANHALIMFVTWLVLGISEYNLKITIENIKARNENL